MRTLTRACLAVAGLSAAAAVAAAAAHPADALSVLVAAWAVAVLSVTLVGAAAVRAAPRHPVAWILLAAGTLLPPAIAGFVAARAAYVHGVGIPAARWAGWLDGWPWAPGLCLVPTGGLLRSPAGRLPPPRWRWVERVAIATVVALFGATLLERHLLDYPHRLNPTG